MSSGSLLGGASTFSNLTGVKNNGYYELPPQTISFSKKNEEWKKGCMDFFSYQWASRTKDRKRKMNNYRLVNGNYNFRDYSYAPSMLQESTIDIPGDEIIHYSICNLPLKSIWGEEINRPFNYRFKSEGEQSTNEYINHMSEMLFSMVVSQIQQTFIQRFLEMGVDPNTEDFQKMVQESKANQMNLENIENYRKYSFCTIAEKTANALSKKYEKELRLTEKFRMGWKDATIVAEEFYWTGIINNKLVCEVKNPVNIVYSKSYDVEYIDESDWVVCGEYQSPSKILDTYKNFLTIDQVKELTDGTYGQDNGKNMNNSGTGPSSIYTGNSWESNTVLLNDDLTDLKFPLSEDYPIYNFSGVYETRSLSGQRHYLVTHAEWQSKRKLALLTYQDDETGEWLNDVVEGDLKLDPYFKSLGWSIEYFYINEVWEGTKIGEHIYIKIQPKQNAPISLDSLETKKLGYTGLIYNRRNARSVSILDEMKPYNELYNIIMSKLKDDLTSELGQLVLMDLNQIPTKQGWDTDKWFDWLKRFKIVFVDAMKNPQFNQFTVLNASLMQSIAQKLSALEFLERKIYMIAGVSPERMGSPIAASSTATENVNRINQSYSQTEDYFYQHNMVKTRVLQNLIENAKVLYSQTGDTAFTYFLDDMSLGFLKITPEFSFSDLCIYPMDSSRDLKTLETLKQLAQPAMQNGASLYDVANILDNDNIQQIKEYLKDVKKSQDQFRQAQQELEQQKLQAMQAQKEMEIAADYEEKERQRNHEAIENQLDREKDIYLAEIKALGTQSLNNPDVNNNQIPDIIESSKLNLEKLKENYNQLAKDREINLKEKEVAIKEREQKRKDVESKEKLKIQKESLKVDKANQKNDLEIEKIRLESAKIKSKKK